MDIIVLTLRIVIIGVLIVSAIAKIPDRRGSEEAMAGFGVPSALIPICALLLPWIELVLAAGLLFAPTLPWAALLATLMFLIFTVAVTRAVIAKEALDCHCFGQLDSGPVTGFTVARNIALTAGSGVVLCRAWFRGSTSIWEDLTWLRAGIGAVTVVMLAMLWVIWRQRQTLAELSERVNELQTLVPASRMPKQAFTQAVVDHTLGTVDGSIVQASSVYTRGKPTLLVFVSGHCRACNALVPHLLEWQELLGDVMHIAVIGVGEMSELQLLSGQLNQVEVYFTRDGEIQADLGVRATPTAILIDHDGFIRQKPALGGDKIRRLVDHLIQQAGV